MSVFELVFIFCVSLVSVLATAFILRWLLEFFYNGRHSEKIAFVIVAAILAVGFVDQQYPDRSNISALAGLAAGLIVTWLIWFRPSYRSGSSDG